MSSRIEVCVRLRPDPDMDGVDIHSEAGTIEVTSTFKARNKIKGGGVVDNNASRIKFTADKVLPPTATQRDVFEACGRPFIEKFFEGYNGTIMAYGQTGAGKTFTVMGPAGGQYEERGLCARILTSVFEEAERRRRAPDASGRCPEVTLHLSALEIYNESVLDLLAPPSDPRTLHPPPPEDLPIYENEEGGIVVPGLVLAPVTCLDDALHCLFAADMARAVGEHDLNADSTRSHCIYTLHLTVCSPGAEEEGSLSAKLHIVDLAGSERIFRTGSVGVLQKEAAYINKSLSFLEQVVVALTDERREHIPYRQSKLTHFLKDSLNGSCRTLLIACVWPVPYHGDQTLSTLRFARRMMCIRTDPVVNRRFDAEGLNSAQVAKLARTVRELREELVMHDRLAGRDLAGSFAGGAPYGELTPDMWRAVDGHVAAFLQDPSSLPPVLTLAQVRATYVRLRDAATATPPSLPSSHPLPTTTPSLPAPRPPSAPKPPSTPPTRRNPAAQTPAPPPASHAPTSSFDSIHSHSHTPPTSRRGRRRPAPPGPTSLSFPPPRYPHPATQRSVPPTMAFHDPPTARSYFQESERETGEAMQGEGMARRGDEEEEEGYEDEGGREGHTGGGAELDREKAFAAFRLTETGMRDASVLKTVKARLRQVKERLRSTNDSLTASRAELGPTFVNEGMDLEDEDEEEEFGEEESLGTAYAEGYMRRDAKRRAARLRQQVEEMQQEAERLQGDKKAAVAHMVRDFKHWWRDAQREAGTGTQPRRAGKHGAQTGEGEREGEESPLVLPAVALPRHVRTTGGMDERGPPLNPHLGPPLGPRPWSMAEMSESPSRQPTRHSPLLSSAQVSYEAARHHALAGSANRAMAFTGHSHHRDRSAGGSMTHHAHATGRSPGRASAQGQRAGAQQGQSKWPTQAPPRQARTHAQPPHHRRHSAGM